jgi:hypothetical protein
MNLVFVKERTLPALRESLLERRTVVWYKDQLIGREEWLKPLFDQCVSVAPPHLRNDKFTCVRISNAGAADIHLTRSGDAGPARLDLPAGSTIMVRIDVPAATPSVELHYTATNFLIAPSVGLPVVLRVGTAP